ncbi:MAG TPA: hypothetical protein VGP12_02705, partial [Nitrosospira sp.]|nr:hypothetical protein [Nitrosospira sp.]
MYRTTSHRNRYALFTKVASGIIILAGALVMLSWIPAASILHSFIPAAWTVEFNTGVGLLLSGVSLWLLSAYPANRTAQWSSGISAALVALIGAVTLVEYITHTDLRIGEYLLMEFAASARDVPDRMDGVVAVIFVLLGIAMLLLAVKVQSRWVDALTILAMLNALIPPFGYMYGTSFLYRIPYYGSVALPTTLVLVVLCAGLLASRPDRGLMALLTNKSAGGITARRLLPAAIFIPLLIDRLQYWGQTAGFYDSTFARVLFTLSSMVIFTSLIAWNARLLLQLDMRRDRAEDNLRGTLQKLGSNIQALSQANSQLHS